MRRSRPRSHSSTMSKAGRYRLIRPYRVDWARPSADRVLGRVGGQLDPRLRREVLGEALPDVRHLAHPAGEHARRRCARPARRSACGRGRTRCRSAARPAGPPAAPPPRTSPRGPSAARTPRLSCSRVYQTSLRPKTSGGQDDDLLLLGGEPDLDASGRRRPATRGPDRAGAGVDVDPVRPSSKSRSSAMASSSRSPASAMPRAASTDTAVPVGRRAPRCRACRRPCRTPAPAAVRRRRRRGRPARRCRPRPARRPGWPASPAARRPGPRRPGGGAGRPSHMAGQPSRTRPFGRQVLADAAAPGGPPPAAARRSGRRCARCGPRSAGRPG